MTDPAKLNFQKMDGILPAVIQDAKTKQVLMLGFMNETALRQTLQKQQVVLWSRSKQRLWRKGETSGNTLNVVSVAADCDNDSLLIGVKPDGPTCHTGAVSCFEPAPPYN
jgi:phosphoribosyl-AMP cyclohydrolase / phosphoribosyl-ATP pyrophosphohydrolase